MQGWVSLHRKMLQSDIFQNEKLFKIFMYCLMKASHKDRSQRIGMQVVELKKGQFVFGRKVAATELNMNESTVYQYIKILEEDEAIKIDSNNKFSVVSIVNWCFYQDDNNNITTKEQQNNNKITAKEQQNNTNNNVNNVENVNNVNKEIVPSQKSKTDFDESHLRLAKLLYSEMLKNNPKAKEPNFNKWASEFRKAMTIDDRTHDNLKNAIIWSQQDSFWHTNILSAVSLRKQYDKLVLKAGAEQIEKKEKQKQVTQSIDWDSLKEG